MEEWTIRNILNPVITRLLIYGVNPIDLEFVLSSVETSRFLNTKQLEKEWLEQWEKKAVHFLEIAHSSETMGNVITAREMYMTAAQCYYACFLINFSDIEQRKSVYCKYRDAYAEFAAMSQSPVKKVYVPVDNKIVLPAYLHYPSAPQSKGCVVIFSGLGSCKEEMHILAKSFSDRGIAALVPDMPGNGESLICGDVKCRMETLKKTFGACVDFLYNQKDVDSSSIGVCGLCMGGGYAYKAAAIDKRYDFCINLFPLFINEVKGGVTPQWMRSGPWYNFQTGGVPSEEFLKEMGLDGTENAECPYYLVHGKYDNWMLFESAMKLYDKISHSEKKLLVIEDRPAFSNGQEVTHTMPVGEQMHWVKHLIADWACGIIDSGKTVKPS